MNSIVAIRTNRWTEEEERLLASLQQAKGDDVVVVFHGRPENVNPPVPVVDINRDWAESAGLTCPDDWGWRCGDYFYYALRAARPGYDFYWLVEPDVLFSGDATGFFAAFDDAPEDVLGVRPGVFNKPDHPFLETLGDLTPYQAIFALTRFSGRALDRLLELRRAHQSQPKTWNGFANDELFTFSHACADPDLSVGDMTKVAPAWFDGAFIRTDPDALMNAVLDMPDLRDKVFHPVKSKEAWKKSVARRLSNKTGFLFRMKPSLGYLSDQDIREVADLARNNLLAALQEARGN